MKKIILSFLFLLFLTHIAFGKTFDLFVNRVIDGDTIVGTLVNVGIPIKVRFAKIDTFEIEKNKHILKQEKITGLSKKEIIEKGLQAKEFVKNQIEHKIVCVKIPDKNPTGAYGRYIGFVFTKPCENLDLIEDESLNQMLLEKHLAILYSKE
jgi:endonuclease YncB( thermonuclease family)